jgi:hypothetical protein
VLVTGGLKRTGVDKLVHNRCDGWNGGRYLYRASANGALDQKTTRFSCRCVTQTSFWPARFL